MPNREVPCRWCGKPATFVDRYLVPFVEDEAFFGEGMNVYYCRAEGVGFAAPVPPDHALRAYYEAAYRDRRRRCPEDPHGYYAVVTSTPLAESQFAYVSQFVDFRLIRTVIDLGCGHGVLLRRIRRDHPGARLIGIELDPAVGPFLREIGAEFVNASVSGSVDAICDAAWSDALLICSHTLHYLSDPTFLRDVIRVIRAKGARGVFLFVEVTNDPLDDPAYVGGRVYDVPKLSFFTPGAFASGFFDVKVIHVSTTGWPLERELAFRRSRLERYRNGGRRRPAAEVAARAKALVPLRVRMSVKRALSGGGATDDVLDYFSYGSDRRAIRMIGSVA